MIGHKGHPEVEGAMGQADGGVYLVEKAGDVAGLQVADAGNLAYVTQTTLSMDDASQIIAALKQRYPEISGPKKNDICYATQNRQDGVKTLAQQCDVVIVVGSPNSSNSNRLREVARNMGWMPGWWITPARLILGGCRANGKWALLRGASAPEVLVREVIERLQSLGAEQVESLPGIQEKITFPLPKALA